MSELGATVRMCVAAYAAIMVVAGLVIGMAAPGHPDGILLPLGLTAWALIGYSVPEVKK